MFVEGEAVGHSGDEIGDDFGGGLRARPIRLRIPHARQAVRLGDEEPEQVARIMRGWMSEEEKK